MKIIREDIQKYLEEKLVKYQFKKPQIVLDLSDKVYSESEPIIEFIENLIYKETETNHIEAVLVSWKDYTTLVMYLGAKVQFLQIEMKENFHVEGIRLAMTQVIPA